MNLKILYGLFAQHPEAQWIMRPENAQRLYQFVKAHDVKRVLDLGTGIGCAAAVASLALREKGVQDGEVHTVDQYGKCVALAKGLIPPELQGRITFHLSPVEAWQVDTIPFQYFSVYAEVPEGPFDLVVNDGPSPFLAGGHLVEIPNATVTRMLLGGTLAPGTFVAWDGRVTALKLLERYFSDNFYLVQPGGTSDFNVVQRKDNPVQFLDDTLEHMKESGYFAGTEPAPKPNPKKRPSRKPSAKA